MASVRPLALVAIFAVACSSSAPPVGTASTGAPPSPPPSGAPVALPAPSSSIAPSPITSDAPSGAPPAPPSDAIKERVVLDAKTAGMFAPAPKLSTSWRPDDATIAALEAKLPAAVGARLRHHRLSDYRAQYQGWELPAGKRWVAGNYFCSDEGPTWKTEWIFVNDGGDCFFNVVYRVSDGTFTKVEVNGVG